MKSKKNKTKGVITPGATDDPGLSVSDGHAFGAGGRDGDADDPGPSVSDGQASGAGRRDGDADPDFENMQSLLRNYLEKVSDLNLESARKLLDQGMYLKSNKYFQHHTDVTFRVKVDQFSSVLVRWHFNTIW